jgi:hypothetical protein
MGVDLSTAPSNELIAELEVFPDYGTIVIGDAGKSVLPDNPPTRGEALATASEHTLLILTMTADTADDLGRDVTVRVYRGSDAAGLGDLAFDGILTFSEPNLAIGEILDTAEDRHKVPINRTGRIPLHVYVRTTIPGAPASDATDINILLDDVE